MLFALLHASSETTNRRKEERTDQFFFQVFFFCGVFAGGGGELCLHSSQRERIAAPTLVGQPPAAGVPSPPASLCPFVREHDMRSKHIQHGSSSADFSPKAFFSHMYDLLARSRQTNRALIKKNDVSSPPSSGLSSAAFLPHARRACARTSFCPRLFHLSYRVPFVPGCLL